MNPQAEAAFVPFLLKCGEGAVRFMYLDQAVDPSGEPAPVVTTGDGDALFTLQDAFGLEWFHPDGSRAGGGDIAAAYALVKRHPELAPQGGGAFERLTTIRASQESIDRLIKTKMAGYEQSLRAGWPGWDDPTLPWPAQVALMRLAWACGTRPPKGVCAAGWPHLHAAWVARDWKTCVRECAIPALAKTEPQANVLEAELFVQCLAIEQGAKDTPGAPGA